MPDTHPPQTTEQVLLTWKASLRPHIERSKQWYMIAGGALLAIAGYSVIIGSWSVALVAILCGAMYFLVRDHKLPEATATITEKGMQVNANFINWNDAKGYWFLLAPDRTELHVVPKTPRADVIIQAEGVDMAALRKTLGTFIPELTDQRERLLDAFIRICKL